MTLQPTDLNTCLTELEERISLKVQMAIREVFDSLTTDEERAVACDAGACLLLNFMRGYRDPHFCMGFLESALEDVQHDNPFVAFRTKEQRQ